MKYAPRVKLHPDKVKRNDVKRGDYLLRLFMVGNGPNSKQALDNLRNVCQEYLAGHYTIETVDVVKDSAAAAKANILITPALMLVAPGPTVIILGNLSDRQKLLLALRLPSGDS